LDKLKQTKSVKGNNLQALSKHGSVTQPD